MLFSKILHLKQKRVLNKAMFILLVLPLVRFPLMYSDQDNPI